MRLFGEKLRDSPLNLEKYESPVRVLQPTPKKYSQSEIKLVEQLENLVSQVKEQNLDSDQVQSLLDATNLDDDRDVVREDTKDVATMERETAEAAAYFVTGWWVLQNYQKVKDEASTS